MKITYHKPDNIIQIKDSIKLQHGLIWFIVVINLFNTVLNLYEKRSEPFDSIHFIWISIGLVSAGLVVHLLLRKSVKEKIAPDEILQIKEKSWLGRKRIILKLKNGKERDVSEWQNPAEIEKFRKLIGMLRPDLFAETKEDISLNS